MSRALTVVTALIIVFAVASGGYKVTGGEADLRVFASLGMTPLAVRVFGAVQAVAGLTILWRPFGVMGASVLVLCNLLATVGLFAAGQQPFGWVSWIFVAMAGAAVSWARRRRGPEGSSHASSRDAGLEQPVRPGRSV